MTAVLLAATLTVATYNIRNAKADKGIHGWDVRRDAAIGLLAKTGADLFALQEVQPWQYDDFKKGFLDFDFIGVCREDGDRVGEAVPIGYRRDRFEKVDSGTFWLSETPDVPGSRSWGTGWTRICTWAYLRERTSGDMFALFNAHLDAKSSEAQTNGMALVLRKIRLLVPKGTPILITGDHNCQECDMPARQAVAAGFRHAILESETPPQGTWRSYTAFKRMPTELSAVDMLRHSAEERCGADLRAAGGGWRIDYIYVSDGISVETVRTWNDVGPNGEYPSDHYPVSARLRLNPRRRAVDCRPETWFHLIGGNVSKEGLTADLEAIAEAGYGGVQLFHGQYGPDEAWPGTSVQVPCLSKGWDDVVRHVADECARLGLSFKMQNCPGWSMSGGPWISPSHAMRRLVYIRAEVTDGEAREIPIPDEWADADSDWKDVAYLAFPTPSGDMGRPLEPMRKEDVRQIGRLIRTVSFEKPVTVRTLELPPPREINRSRTYMPDAHVCLEALVGDSFKTVRTADYPTGCWQDDVPFSLACGESLAREWRLTMSSSYSFDLPFARYWSGARLDNWEGLSGSVLRGKVLGVVPVSARESRIAEGTVREIHPGEHLCDGCWTVLRIGHVNMKRVNKPAPREATGWECDKLDPRGIETNFAGYIGRLTKGVLAGGKLKGMVVDSWECERQNWTWRMEEYFRKANGYDVRYWLPAVFGWIVGDERTTKRFLLDWRRTIAELITKNYYRRMAELAHAAGLEVAYETSFGDVVPGDILEYWKYCDTPMCEFWQPYDPSGFRGHPSYKPVRPCVSAAHVYGKHRIAAEAFTNIGLTWDESPRILKEQAVRHYARGITHLVTHTYTHNPQVGWKRPGTSFGSFIGTPFLRGQTWWSFMPAFTGWIAECGAFLERGLPVVDVLRYLGDDVGHKPEEVEALPAGFKSDYLNRDALLSRVQVRDGRFVLPDGMSYARIWIPEGTFVLPDASRRLDELARQGGTVVRGTSDDAVRTLSPQVVSSADPESLLWYHRIDGDEDLYFLAAETNGFKGIVDLRTQHGVRRVDLELGPTETRLLTFGKRSDGTLNTMRSRIISHQVLNRWTLSFPAGWGAADCVKLNGLMAWKDLPAVSEETRSFSGTAVYETTFEADGQCGIHLSLGRVRDCARVLVNGREAAALWSEPYVCDITPFVRTGTNMLRIEVASTWFNRLAYDFAQPESQRKTWTVWNLAPQPPPCFKPGATRRDSGLLGPVRLDLVHLED